ncbi:hypothetical protein X805_02820 [Sphaerotilus natans subsp. natans DSM 6575]|uniref:Uncharacterized protein n=1 Tax=Sphaerotilus natans subsp. natans DSM 6575 TaxID=1286631 RepID=A0A059KS87_9BURK|nr:hypothetical protein X805_02820 [Sphaerotilus natans subsp. natans DSM 6575]
MGSGSEDQERDREGRSVRSPHRATSPQAAGGDFSRSSASCRPTPR